MTTFRLLALLGLTAAATACGTSSTSAAGEGNVALNVATTTQQSAVEGPIASEEGRETYTANGDTLVITRVELVLREIELEFAEGATGCVRGDDDDDDDDDCEELELNARLLDLPLGRATGAERTVAVDVPAGFYEEVEFEIHKASRSDDAAFLAQNPGLEDVSIRVTGTFNGEPFTYVTGVEEEYELEFNPPLEVTEGGTTNFTVNVDLATWFRAQGGALIDPRTANRGQPNESLVNENIKRSIQAFDDDDRDGYDDDDDDNDDD